MIDEEVPGRVEPASWPWNSIGGCGASRVSAVSARRRGGIDQRGEPLAEAEVRDLVVVLEVVTNRVRARPREEPRPWLCQRAELALVEEAVLGGRDQLLRRAAVVVEVAIDDAGQRHARGVVAVVVPQHVELDRRPEQRGVLRLVLADEEDPPPAAGLPRAA